MEKYEIVRNLGRGSYGSVDLARIRPTPGSPSSEKEQLFAIKKIKLKHLNAEERKKALDEASVLQNLNHPNIVQFKESFEQNNSFYIAMEYIDGGDLEKKIQQRGSSYMTEREVLFMFVQILSPIAYLHNKKILHRDIKPQNCFITKHGIVKIGDFGVARSLDTTFDLAKTVIGTPFYLAPEIWDNHPYGYAADIYSLGVVLYSMCSLKKPFDADSATQLFTKVMKHDFTPIPYFFSNDLHRLVDQMLSKDPALRPSADEILKLPFIQKAIRELVEFNKKQIDEIPSVKLNSTGAKQEKKGSLAGGRGRLLSMNFASKSSESFNDTNNTTVKKSNAEGTLKSTQNATIVKTKVDSDNKPIAQQSNKTIARKQNVRDSKTIKQTINKQTISRNKNDDDSDGPGMDFEDDFVEFEDDFISDDEDDGKSSDDENNDDSENSNSFEDDFDDSFTLLEDVTMRLQESLIPSKVREESKKAVDNFRATIVKEIGQSKMEEIYTNLKQLEDPSCLIKLRKLERENKEAVDKVKELIAMEESI